MPYETPAGGTVGRTLLAQTLSCAGLCIGLGTRAESAVGLNVGLDARIRPAEARAGAGRGLAIYTWLERAIIRSPWGDALLIGDALADTALFADLRTGATLVDSRLADASGGPGGRLTRCSLIKWGSSALSEASRSTGTECTTGGTLTDTALTCCACADSGLSRGTLT
jgi:hypothetical protein